MPSNVVAGAMLNCTMGAAPCALSVLPRQALVEGRPAATIMDHVTGVNIPTFGVCNSLANPATAALTLAAAGSLTPAPCVPSTPAPWVPGAPTSLIAGQPALTVGSQCACTWGGVISVTVPGTVTVQTA